MLKQFGYAATVASLASVAISFTATHAAQSSDTIVTIDSGAIQGAISGDVVAFKGIPYAAPPVGALRWREPQPVTPWRETRSATKYGPDCVQKPVGGDVAPTAGEFGEDCLFVSVWRPMGLKADARLPVLVWIHGGGFLNGGTTDPYSDASTLARQGLVVVKLNYRLGRLGFFTHPAWKATGEDAPANYAFLDQLAALRWVRRNVAAFGGDPQQITIAGESAGGVSVMHHLTWPAAHGLFQRAVVMSGGGRTYGIGPPSVARAEEAGLAFAKTMGVAGTGADARAALRALPVEKINGDLSMEALITKPRGRRGSI